MLKYFSKKYIRFNPPPQKKKPRKKNKEKRVVNSLIATDRVYKLLSMFVRCFHSTTEEPSKLSVFYNSFVFIVYMLHRQNCCVWISPETSFTWNSREIFTWISRDIFFKWISHETVTWFSRKTRFTWNSCEIFHVNCRWNEFHIKFTWNMHLYFTWILWVEIYSRVSISVKKIKWKKICSQGQHLIVIK